MIGSKLRDLTDYFLSLGLVAAEQLDSYIDDGELKLVTRKLDNNNLKLAQFDYQAAFEFTAVAKGPDLLLAHLAMWLQEHDSDRNNHGLADPQIGVDINEQGVAEVEISLHFIEDIELVADDAGELLYKGKKYRLDYTALDVADTAAVDTEEGRTPDKPHTIGDS